MATGRLNDAIIGEIVDDVLSRGASDWVDLSEIIWRAKENASLHGIELSEDEKVDASLEVIRIVLNRKVFSN